MKAKELRIGNYFKPDSLYRKEFDFEIVTPNHLMDFATDPQDDYYKPIPLTEAWLVKFGFERKEGRITWILLMPDYEATIQLWSGNREVSICRWGIAAYHSRCEYVHQLQNLYFALTGEELEYVQ